ncbi:hypothetical protein HanHA300_Chr02g0062071 [Helianthus annuus]|nr:hypothetical protein HanHA300_Chr02g0062071 [Helianthus annuus]KAJ0619368.1 hypothetical protein HanHA89_Chr02g0070581 [Helianthus annuus]
MEKTLIPKFTYINRSYNPYNHRLLTIDNIITRNLFIYIFYCLCVRNPLNTRSDFSMNLRSTEAYNHCGSVESLRFCYSPDAANKTPLHFFTQVCFQCFFFLIFFNLIVFFFFFFFLCEFELCLVIQ